MAPRVDHFARHNLPLVEHELRNALKVVEANLGVAIEIVPGGSYSSRELPLRIVVKTIDPVTGATHADPMLDLMCQRHGLDPSITSYDGYTLVGYKSSRPKFPWEIKTRQGKQMKATHGWVEARFKRKAGSAPPTPAPITPATPTQASKPPHPGPALRLGVLTRRKSREGEQFSLV